MFNNIIIHNSSKYITDKKIIEIPKGTAIPDEKQNERAQKFFETEINSSIKFEAYDDLVTQNIPIKAKYLLGGLVNKNIVEGINQLEEVKDYDIYYALKHQDDYKKAYSFVLNWIKDNKIDGQILPGPSKYSFKFVSGKYECLFSSDDDYGERHIGLEDGLEIDFTDKENLIIKFSSKFDSIQEFLKAKYKSHFINLNNKGEDFPHIERINRQQLNGYIITTDKLKRYYKNFQYFIDERKKNNTFVPGIVVDFKIKTTVTGDNTTAELIAYLNYLFSLYVLNQGQLTKNQEKVDGEIIKSAIKQIEKKIQRKDCFSTFISDICQSVLKNLDNIGEHYSNLMFIFALCGINVFSDVTQFRFSSGKAITICSNNDIEDLPVGKKLEFIYWPIHSTEDVADRIFKSSWVSSFNIYDNQEIKDLAKQTSPISLTDFFKKIPKVFAQCQELFERGISETITPDLIFERWDGIIDQWEKYKESDPDNYMANLAIWICLGALLDPENAKLNRWLESYCDLWMVQIFEDTVAIKECLIPVFPAEIQLRTLIRVLKESKKSIKPSLVHELTKTILQNTSDEICLNLYSDLISNLANSNDKKAHQLYAQAIHELIRCYQITNDEKLFTSIVYPNTIFTPISIRKLNSKMESDEIAQQCCQIFLKIIDVISDKKNFTLDAINAMVTLNSCSLEVQQLVLKTQLSLVEAWLTRKQRNLEELKLMWEKIENLNIFNLTTDQLAAHDTIKIIFFNEFIKSGPEGIGFALEIVENLSIDENTIASLQEAIRKTVVDQKWEIAAKLLDFLSSHKIDDDLVNLLLSMALENPKSTKAKKNFLSKMLELPNFKIEEKIARKYTDIIIGISSKIALEFIIDMQIFSLSSLKKLWPTIEKGSKPAQMLAKLTLKNLEELSVEERVQVNFIFEELENEDVDTYVRLVLPGYNKIKLDELILYIEKVNTNLDLFIDLHNQALLLPIFSKCLAKNKNMVSTIILKLKNERKFELEYEYLQLLINNKFFKMGDVELTKEIINRLKREEFDQLVSVLKKEGNLESVFELISLLENKISQDQQELFKLGLSLMSSEAHDLKKSRFYFDFISELTDFLDDTSKLHRIAALSTLLQILIDKDDYNNEEKRSYIKAIVTLFMKMVYEKSESEEFDLILEKIRMVNYLLALDIASKGSSLLLEIADYVGFETIEKIALTVIRNATQENKYLLFIVPQLIGTQNIEWVYAIYLKEKEFNQILFTESLVEDLPKNKRTILNNTLIVDIMIQNTLESTTTGLYNAYKLLLENLNLEPTHELFQRNLEQFLKINEICKDLNVESLSVYLGLLKKMKMHSSDFEKLHPFILKTLLGYFLLLPIIPDENLRIDYLKTICQLIKHKSFLSYYEEFIGIIYVTAIRSIDLERELLVIKNSEQTNTEDEVFDPIADFYYCFSLLPEGEKEKEILASLLDSVEDKAHALDTDFGSISFAMELIFNTLNKKKSIDKHAAFIFNMLDLFNRVSNLNINSRILENWLSTLNLLRKSENILVGEENFDRFVTSIFNLCTFSAVGNDINLNTDCFSIFLKLEKDSYEARKKKKVQKNSLNRQLQEYFNKYEEKRLKIYLTQIDTLTSSNYLPLLKPQIQGTYDILLSIEQELTERQKIQEFYEIFIDSLYKITQRIMHARNQVRVLSEGDNIIDDQEISYVVSMEALHVYQSLEKCEQLSVKFSKKKYHNESEEVLTEFYKTFFRLSEPQAIENYQNQFDTFVDFSKNCLFLASIFYQSYKPSIPEEKLSRIKKEIDFLQFSDMNASERKIILNFIQIIAKRWIYENKDDLVVLLDLVFDAFEKKEWAMTKKEKLDSIASIIFAFLDHPEKNRRDFFNVYLKIVNDRVISDITSKEEYIYALNSLLIPFMNLSFNTKTILHHDYWCKSIKNLIEVFCRSLDLVSYIETYLCKSLLDLQRSLSIKINNVSQEGIFSFFKSEVQAVELNELIIQIMKKLIFITKDKRSMAFKVEGVIEIFEKLYVIENQDLKKIIFEEKENQKDEEMSTKIITEQLEKNLESDLIDNGEFQLPYFKIQKE